MMATLNEGWLQIYGTEIFMAKLITISKIFGITLWCSIPEEQLARWLSSEQSDLQCKHVLPCVALWNGCAEEAMLVHCDTNTKKLTNSKNLFKIFQQNIRGLRSKVDELSNSLFPDYPNIICLTEHHLKDYEIDNLPIDRFKLGSKFCRHEFKNLGGVGYFWSWRSWFLLYRTW